MEKLSGLLFGGFTDCKDTERPFGQELPEILQAIVQEYNYPNCYDFPVSHTPRNYALKYGVNFQLNVLPDQVILQEATV